MEKKMQRIREFRMKLDHNVKAGTKGFQKKENTASKAMKVRFLPENHKLIEDYCKAMEITFSQFLREAAKKHLISESEKLQREKETEMA